MNKIPRKSHSDNIVQHPGGNLKHSGSLPSSLQVIQATYQHCSVIFIHLLFVKAFFLRQQVQRLQEPREKKEAVALRQVMGTAHA